MYKYVYSYIYKCIHFTCMHIPVCKHNVVIFRSRKNTHIPQCLSRRRISQRVWRSSKLGRDTSNRGRSETVRWMPIRLKLLVNCRFKNIIFITPVLEISCSCFSPPSLACFRELCALCWMLHVRDQLSISCRKYQASRLLPSLPEKVPPLIVSQDFECTWTVITYICSSLISLCNFPNLI